MTDEEILTEAEGRIIMSDDTRTLVNLDDNHLVYFLHDDFEGVDAYPRNSRVRVRCGRIPNLALEVERLESEESEEDLKKISNLFKAGEHGDKDRS